MEGYGVIFAALLLLAFIAGLLLSLLTNLRGLPAALFGMALVFAFTFVGLEFLELAFLAAVIAALPSLAGAGVGAMIRNRRTG